MEQETLFTSAKWSILKALAHDKKSPLELAKITNTSMSNISQSLRFLELANIVKSERVSNRDKGQPRVVYSIAKDSAYLIITADGFVEKKLLEIDDHKKSLIRIWLYPKTENQDSFEQAYFELKKRFDEIGGIFIDEQNNSFCVIYNNEGDKVLVESVKVNFISVEDVQANPGKYYPIYDPQKISKRIII